MTKQVGVRARCTHASVQGSFLRTLSCMALMSALVLVAVDGHAQLKESPKRQVIRELMSITTRGDVAWDRVSEPFIMSARAANPEAAAETWTDLQTHARHVIAKAAREYGPDYKMLLRYEDKFTEQEARELLDFFKTDLGAKFATEMAVMLLEYEQANAAYLTRTFPRLKRDLKPFFDQRGLKMPGNGGRE